MNTFRPVPLAGALGLAALLGAVLSLPLTHTPAWPLALLSIAGLHRLVSGQSTCRAALLGQVFGTAWLVATTWWLFISMHRYGGLPTPLAALAVLLLSAALSSYLAVAMAWFARNQSGRARFDGLLFAAVWLLAELARAALFTGFPWGASGYTQIDGPLAGLAPWLGVYGIGAVAAALSVGLSHSVTNRSRRYLNLLLVVAALLFSAALRPLSFTQRHHEMSVALLQANVPQDEKFASEHLDEQLDWLRRQLLFSSADLTVTPETGIPLLPTQLQEHAPDYWPVLVKNFAEGSQGALVGLPLNDAKDNYTNSVIGLSATRGNSYRYDKHHLVPFGEFIPTGFRWFVALMDIPLGDFTRGPVLAPSFTLNEQRIAPNICYEDLFGEELAARFKDAGTAPTVLVNISNIGWFGNTIAVDQHLNISRMRTLELQRPMLRATNTGATAIVDHRGQVQALLPPFTQAVLRGRVEGRVGLTPFARWASTAGLWPLLLAGLAASVAIPLWRRRAAP